MIGPPRRILTMIERLKKDAKASAAQASQKITLETVDQIMPDGRFVVAGATLGVTGDGSGIQVGQQVGVAWSNGAPQAIVFHHAQSAQFVPALGAGGGIVEELFVAANGEGFLDVFFRNDQQITALKLTTFLEGFSASQVQAAWGMSPDSFFVAVGDQSAPAPSFQVHVFTLNRTPTKVIGAGGVRATFEKTWTASSVSLHLSTINFNAQVFGSWIQLTSATFLERNITMNWIDSLEIEFQDMLSKNLLKFKSIVLDEAHDIYILFSADVEQRRSGFGTIFPRASTFDSSGLTGPAQPAPGGGTYDTIPSFFIANAMRDRILNDINFNPFAGGTFPFWAVDPGVHFFLAKVNGTPLRKWKTLRDPFNFTWRKVFSGAFPPDSATAIALRKNTGQLILGALNLGLFAGGGAIGDQLNGSGPAAGATFRDPVDTGSIGFADGEQENMFSATGALLGAAPQESISELYGPYTFDFGGAGGLGVDVFSNPVTYTRTWQKLWRSHKWKFDAQQPVYLGRRTTDAKGDTYKPPGTLGVVAIVGERVPGASGFTYVPVTILSGAPTLIDSVESPPGNGTIDTFWPYPVTTRDSVSGAEDFTGIRQESVASVDIKSGVPRLLRPVFTRASGDTLTVVFSPSSEFHVLWIQTQNNLPQIWLAQVSTGLSLQVGVDAVEFNPHRFMVLRPDQFYQAQEGRQRFVIAWDQKTGSPTLLQPNYRQDSKLLGRGVLRNLGAVAPLTSGSYQAIDDRSLSQVNLKPAGT